MKTKLLFFFLLGWSIITHAQINVSESFETDFPTGWSTTGHTYIFTRTNNPTYACDGSWAMYAPLYATNSYALITTPNYTSDGNSITVSFNYNRGTGSITGYSYLFYELNNSGTWVQFATSTDFSPGCKTLEGNIAKGVIPNGSLVKFRMQLSWVSGNIQVFIDNFKAVQEEFYAEYTFDNTLYNTIGKNSFAAANTTFENDRFGVANKALQIAATKTSTANIPYIPKLQSPRTVSVWYKASSNSNYPTIFVYGTNSNYHRFGVYIGPNGNPIFHAYGNDKDFGGSYAANTWHHAVVTYDGSTIKMYMNGTLIGSQAYTLNTGNSVFSIGSGAASIVTIDDLKIYDSALSAIEVAALYAQETLPVELNSFTAKLSNKTTTLLWSTATEVNTSHFDIEYSNNGSEFVKVGNEKAQGYSNAAKHYSYQHITNNQPIHYYRLKMVDKDGKYAYSNIVKLKDAVKTFEASVYPTIVTNTATLSITSKEKANAFIAITSLDGIRIMQKNVEVIEGSQTISLNVEKLTKGSYIVSIKLNNNIESYTIIKQ